MSALAVFAVSAGSVTALSAAAYVGGLVADKLSR